MFIRENEIGFEINSPRFFFFFGKKGSTLDNLKNHYPQFDFYTMKQVHGYDIVDRTADSQSSPPQADGQFTQEKDRAVTVATADCIPVLVVHPPTQTVMALHAGWRGVANRIIPKGLEKLTQMGANSSELFVILGPHIQARSFEVGNEVRDQILQSVKDGEKIMEMVCKPLNSEKSLVDLNAIAKLQIAEFMLPADQIFNLHVDTFSDQRFHSFRRDKDSAGRQLSFVVRK